MGQGAFVSIQNASARPLTVSYSNFVCMYDNGDDGSDFGPISGTLPAGQALPPTGTAYIEADASLIGGCSTTTSTFTMTIQSPDGNSLAIPFTESGNSFAAPSRVYQGRLNAMVSIAPGDQDTITVVIHVQPWNNATWMTDLAPMIGPRPLASLVIPGTHDSGTYGITALSPIVPGQDIPQWLNWVMDSGEIGTATVGNVIADWATAQPNDFTTQLNDGIRYFDLRVVLDDSTNDYWICHSKSSVPFGVAVEQIQTFLEANPREIVILDLNHLYNMPTVQTNQPLVNLMLNTFGSRVAPNSMTPSSTMNDFWADGRQVVILYADAATIAANRGELWPESMIVSNYADTQSLEYLLQTFLPQQLAAGNPMGFFVLQGILTPDSGTILAGIAGTGASSLAEQAAAVTPAVTNWVVGSAASRHVNIVIVDWYPSQPGYADILIGLNQ